VSEKPRAHLAGFGLHCPAMKRTYAKVLLLQIVQLALLWWLQQAFL